ncbi:G3E family GTPase [Paenibacillus mucilaginosus]|uniref:CobW family GTP-binding protein n=1 Tax=Paenibacillus mucilaginosus TaxID=61624 RepID=UPI003D20D76B
MNKVPVLILSGFLGSGKTTLLIRLLHEAGLQGLKPGVLMNELGRTDVDAGIIQSGLPGSSVEKLLDGCICCSRKGEVAESLGRLIARQPDVILIELTGVANPEEVAEALTEPFLLNRVELKGIITVLDAEWVLDYNSMFNTDRVLKHTVRRQMETADVILVNKTDLVPPSHLGRIEKAVKQQNDKAVIHFTRYSELPAAPFFFGIQPAARSITSVTKGFKVISRPGGSTASVPAHEHHPGRLDGPAASPSFGRVQTLTLTVPQGHPLTSKQVEQFLALWGGRLLRAKGYLTLSDKKLSSRLLQFAGGRLRWDLSDYHGTSYLVVIGIELQQEQIKRNWEAITGPAVTGQ